MLPTREIMGGNELAATWFRF